MLCVERRVTSEYFNPKAIRGNNQPVKVSYIQQQQQHQQPHKEKIVQMYPNQRQNKVQPHRSIQLRCKYR